MIILALMLAALIALGRDAWALAQNTRSRFRAGTGARHRRPGPATPWRRWSEPDTFTRARPRLVPSIPRWDVDPGSTYFTPITHADRLQAIDLDRLRQLAARPLLPLAVAA